MDARTPLSGGQQRYLITLRRELGVVRLSRAGLFLFFLLLWESTAQKGILDSFIFSILRFRIFHSPKMSLFSQTTSSFRSTF